MGSVIIQDTAPHAVPRVGNAPQVPSLPVKTSHLKMCVMMSWKWGTATPRWQMTAGPRAVSALPPPEPVRTRRAFANGQACTDFAALSRRRSSAQRRAAIALPAPRPTFVKTNIPNKPATTSPRGRAGRTAATPKRGSCALRRVAFALQVRLNIRIRLRFPPRCLPLRRPVKTFGQFRHVTIFRDMDYARATRREGSTQSSARRRAEYAKVQRRTSLP